MAEKKCNGCKDVSRETAQVPYIVHESEVNRLERIIKRQWISLILALVMFFACVIGFAWYESQFETISYDYAQDGEGTNIIGEMNEVVYGAAIKGESKAETQR